MVSETKFLKFLEIPAGSDIVELNEGIGIIAVDLEELRGLLLWI